MGLGNKLIVSATGFPGTNKTLRFIQDAFKEPLGALAQLAGEKTIITGVVVDNTDPSNVTVSDGYIVYNGEIIPFVGGVFANTVTIFEQFENVDYNTDANDDTILDSLPAYRTIYAKCGTGGIDIFNFSQLIRLKKLYELHPVGSIIMWAGAIGDIPAGWKLCDGQNGTPNLIDRFIVGAGGSYNVGATGGTNNVSIAQQNLPNYTMSGTSSNNGSHSHSYVDGFYIENYQNGTGFSSEYVGNGKQGSGGTDGDNRYIWTKSRTTGSGGSHTHTFSVSTGGGNQPLENRPPYFALCYIMFVGL